MSKQRVTLVCERHVRCGDGRLATIHIAPNYGGFESDEGVDHYLEIPRLVKLLDGIAYPEALEVAREIKDVLESHGASVDVVDVVDD